MEAPLRKRAWGCCKNEGALGVLTDFSALIPFFFWAFCHFFYFSAFWLFFERLKNPFQGSAKRISRMKINITFFTRFATPLGIQ
jgi:hypothetical protein